MFHCSISVSCPSPTYKSTSLSSSWPSQNFILFSRGLTIVEAGRHMRVHAAADMRGMKIALLLQVSRWTGVIHGTRARKLGLGTYETRKY